MSDSISSGDSEGADALFGREGGDHAFVGGMKNAFHEIDISV
jgi:hypothetical protein